jgi:hypothetical protein
MSKKQETTAAPVTTTDHTVTLEKLPTTSARIRYLDSQGLKRGEIAKALGIRYQWVRNVLITPLKKVQ